MSDKYTQRDWDRTVGWGKVPKKYDKEYIKGSAPEYEFDIGDIVRSGFVRSYLIQKTKLGMGIE